LRLPVGHERHDSREIRASCETNNVAIERHSDRRRSSCTCRAATHADAPQNEARKGLSAACNDEGFSPTAPAIRYVGDLRRTLGNVLTHL
jgi:hypothetical protein